MVINIDSTSERHGLSFSRPFCLILPEEKQNLGALIRDRRNYR